MVSRSTKVRNVTCAIESDHSRISEFWPSKVRFGRHHSRIWQISPYFHFWPLRIDLERPKSDFFPQKWLFPPNLRNRANLGEIAPISGTSRPGLARVSRGNMRRNVSAPKTGDFPEIGRFSPESDFFGVRGRNRANLGNFGVRGRNRANLGKSDRFRGRDCGFAGSQNRLVYPSRSRKPVRNKRSIF